jgi:uncharacterized oxidoreductase
MRIFSATALFEHARSLFIAARVSRADAELVSRSLVEANRCGHDSHGILRVPQYIGFIRDGRLKLDVPLQVMHETPAALAVDAQWGLGQVQSYRVLDLLIPRATALGVAMGTMKKCGHIGRLGEYAEFLASRGLACFATVNSHGSGQRVAPPGGIGGRISTNPICFGAPTKTDPLILDFGTSAAAEGKVRVAFQKGEAVPEGWLIDAQGKPTTDPKVLYQEPRGTILPFGGAQAYKGFGLGLMLDVLAGGLSGGLCTRADSPLPGLGNAVVFAVFDPKLFGGIEHFLTEATTLCEFVRSSPTVEGGSRIMLPGDPERWSRQQRDRDGIPIPDGTLELLSKTAKELGVAELTA